MPSKVPQTTKPTDAATDAAKPSASGTVTTKGSVPGWRHFRFLAGSVLIAAALLAIIAGLFSFHRHLGSQAEQGAKSGVGSLFLRAADTAAFTPGATVGVTLYENSGSQPVNTVQGAVQYPADKLQIVSVKNVPAFPQEAATDTAAPGLVRVARAVSSQANSVTGVNPVAVLEFKVLQNGSQPVQLGVQLAPSLLVRSTDNRNILPAAGVTSYKLGH